MPPRSKPVQATPANPAPPAAPAKPSNNAAPAAPVQPPTPPLKPFVIDRHTTYQLGSSPVSGYYTLDFDSDAGRQYARNLAHDLLLQAEDREAVKVDEQKRKVARITAILTATTDQTPEEAAAQAEALLAAGIEFRQ